MSACRIALVTILLGVMGFFAPAPGVGQQEGQSRAAQLAVQNRSADIVRVYVLQTGHMVPVGTVESGAESTLSVPPAFLSSGEQVQLVAERVGGGGWYKSEPVTVSASGRVAFTIAENIERSSVSGG